DAEARHALQEAAAKTNAQLIMGGADWRVVPEDDGFIYEDACHRFHLPLPALPGEHQMQNAGLAMAVLLNTVFREPRTPNPEPLIAAGLTNVAWPARLQRLEQGRLIGLLPPNSELWLDGGHNDSGGEVLARHAATWQARDGKKLHLVIGMLTTKDPREFL